jgi:hypothetical protein
MNMVSCLVEIEPMQMHRHRPSCMPWSPFAAYGPAAGATAFLRFLGALRGESAVWGCVGGGWVLFSRAAERHEPQPAP